MPAWSNTDKHISKPKWDVEREVRENVQLPVLTGNTSGNTIIVVSYNDGGQNNVANIGVAAGQYVYFWANGVANTGGQNGNGVPGMFASNTTVASVSGNTVTFAQALFGTVTSSFTVEFDKAIVYNTNKVLEAGYAANTVLVTPTRLANANVTMGNIVPGWVNISKTVNGNPNDAYYGTPRYRHETLVALANPVASNTASGNTGWGTAFSGL